MAGKVKGNVESKIFKFYWTIDQFFADCEALGDYYESPPILIEHFNRVIKCYLKVYPLGMTEAAKEFMSTFVYVNSQNLDGEATDISVDCVVSVLNEKIPDIQIKHTSSFTGEQLWGWMKFRHHNLLNDPKNGALIDDTLTLVCELTFHLPTEAYTRRIEIYKEWLDKIRLGYSDYEEILESGSFSDVTFNVQGKKIKLHKAILSGGSPVFKAMFEHDMKENEQNIVDITDIEYDIMKEFLRFVYSGKVRDAEVIASDLLIVADKYQVIELKAVCEQILYCKLTVDNAIDCLKLAEMCDTIHLKNLVIKFIAGRYKAVAQKPEFGDLLSTLMHQIILAIPDGN